MKNAVNWFEIPATDLDRAVEFYSTVLGIELQKAEFMAEPQAFIMYDQTAVGGAIVCSDRLTPSMAGTLVYLNLETVDNLEQALSKVEPSGGKLLMEKTSIGEFGFIGMMQDSEGNCIGLHAMQSE